MQHPDNQTIIDQYIPYRGKCAFCGAEDARHRILDAIRDRHGAGESAEELAEDFDFPVEFINAVIQSDSE